MPRYEAERGDGFFEIERDGSILRTCTGKATKFRRQEKEYLTEDDARYWYAKTLLKKTWAMKLVGRSQVLASSDPDEPPGSTVLAEEYFASGDDRFLREILRIRSGKWLANRAEPWMKDARPWARRMMLAYILEGCDTPEHKGLVKRLYKLVETANDEVAIAHFMVAFDQLGYRLVVEAAWRRGMRSDPAILTKFYDRDPRANRFSKVTRQYLARRTYRYFRRMVFREPARYVKGILLALPHYRDEALSRPAQLFDAWGLMNALYGDSSVIKRDARGIRLAKGEALADLRPAPRWPDAWKAAEHFAAMFEALVTAQSRTVRNWLGHWLRAHFAAQLAKLPLAQVKRLLFSPHEEVQGLGAELFGKLEGLETLPIADWLELLAITNLDVIGAIVAVVEKHVSPNRLSLEQCVTLACAPIAPVAELGLAWARKKTIATEADLAMIAKLPRARVASVRSAASAWVTSVVTSHPKASSDHLRDLCDAPFADAREHALAAVAEKPALSPPQLWFALTESPYPDVRDVVIANATKWRTEAPPKTLRHVWSSAMLDVHRGSTAKRRVPRQIAERIASHPAEAEELLPILRVALRSVRPTERAAALGALARAMRDDTNLRALATRLVPELVVSEQVST